MRIGFGRHLAWTLAVCALACLAACSVRQAKRVPVEDRMASASAAPTAQAAVPAATGAPDIPVRPGYYAVKPGDTLIRVALETGQNWRDLARWNALDNPNLIEVGQLLRVLPPEAPVATGAAVAQVLPQVPVVGTALGPQRGASAAVSAGVAPPAAAPASAPRPVPAQAVAIEDEIDWVWPARGHLLGGFDEVKNKGLDIAGSAGDTVVAAAGGKVVYAGSSLRGYGNLIILKHSSSFLSAYAHNQTLLVKEDQTVQKGQKIAEMGSSDADRVKLHFELRRLGKPVDPSKYLPQR